VSCAACKFFVKNGQYDAGQCRRFPPQLVVEGHDDTRTFFPYVDADEWCGEFQKNPVPPPALDQE
jgi:hypothetical protein